IRFDWMWRPFYCSLYGHCHTSHRELYSLLSLFVLNGYSMNVSSLMTPFNLFDTHNVQHLSIHDQTFLVPDESFRYANDNIQIRHPVCSLSSHADTPNAAKYLIDCY